jgi:aromatic ring-opening dioxygenase catalytic subunit (LigB family)
MAEIVSIIALAHAPGATGWLDKAPKREQDELLAGYARMGKALRKAKPDVIVGVANDHLLNFPPDNIPDWCVGTAARWHGPAEWFRDWVNIKPYEVAGNPSLARHLVRDCGKRGINLAFSDKLEFDDNWSVPLKFLTPKYDVPLVPIHMNCVVPPLPLPERCHAFGQALAASVRAWPEKERVAIMATGGLSHDPGGLKYFDVDEKFDRWFLNLLEQENASRILREVTIERMIAAGDGGTVELLAWLVALGAAGGRKAKTDFYVPSVALRCGMGGVNWDAP